MKRLCFYAAKVAVIVSMLLATTALINARADMLTVAPASSLTDVVNYKPDWPYPQGNFQSFDTSLDLAFQGNGFAQSAVSKDLIPDYTTIHQPYYANDGFYGNGASWISNSPGSWIKIDLGQNALINTISFGRDRIGGYDDRDPGQFTIEVALYDNIYMNGDDSNDSVEYKQAFNSTMYSYSGIVNGAETLQVTFSNPIYARFIKMSFENEGTAVDEVEVRGTAITPEPASMILLSIGVLGLASLRKKSYKR